MLDCIIRSGRVVDWYNDIDTVTDIAIKDGKIFSVSPCSEPATREIDASGLLVLPGIIDSHMHASSWLGGPMSFKMLAQAGVTTALEMAGPVQSVKEYLLNQGCGLNIGCLEQIRPGFNVATNDPDLEELKTVIAQSLQSGAFGVKLLGGHYPLIPQAAQRLLKYCADNGVYFAVHAGSTENGSNIKGMREIIELAQGSPFHLAHINAYCRGSVKKLEDEIREATELLTAHPEIDTESYLSPINGCSGKCVDNHVESGVTRNCLVSAGYSTDSEGMKKAVADGFAQVHVIEDGVVTLADKQKSLAVWLDKQTDVPVSFSVNPGLSRFFFATAKRDNGAYLVDSFCTDGGGIPRNVIIANGLSLVKFGAMSLKDFVLKSSFAAARLLGLPDKGHFTSGADADVVIVDLEAQKPIYSMAAGRMILDNGCVIGEGATMLTTQEGAAGVKAFGLNAQVVDIASLFKFRKNRFDLTPRRDVLQTIR